MCSAASCQHSEAYDGNSQMRKWFLVVCLSLAIDAGCRSSPRLVFQKGTSSDSEYLTKVFAAPIVVVGAIQSDTLVRGPIHSDGMLIQLRKLKVRVENVLRGDAVLETTTVYYFTWAGAFNGPRPLGFWGVKGNNKPGVPSYLVVAERFRRSSHGVRRVG